MYNCQQALIAHLEAGGFSDARTIAAYAGQLKEAVKLTQLIPALLPVYILGRPAAQEPYHQFDLLVITESQLLEKKTSKNLNLQLAAQVAAYLQTSYIWKPLSGAGVYELDREELDARLILQDARFTVIALGLKIYDRT